MATYAGKPSSFYSTTGGVPVEGAWYSGQRYLGGQLLAPGEYEPGKVTSNEVIAQTNPNNVSYVAQQRQNYTPSAIPQATVSPAPAQPSATASTTPTGAGGPSIFTPPPIDLVGTYNNLVSSSGITAKDAEIAQKRQQASEAKAKIKDNPFLSEATRVGRIAKIDQLANETLSNLQNEVATKRADIQMQLELQTKQFDINSQQAQQNLSQFNTLLSAGALDNASPEDVANITRATGLSSNIIANAINNRKISGYQTSTKSFDDGTNEGFIIYTIDQLGNVISQSKQITGQSSKANQSLPYSSDPGVNSFITQMLNKNTKTNTGNIDSLWSE